MNNNTWRLTSNLTLNSSTIVAESSWYSRPAGHTALNLPHALSHPFLAGGFNLPEYESWRIIITGQQAKYVPNMCYQTNQSVLSVVIWCYMCFSSLIFSDQMLALYDCLIVSAHPSAHSWLHPLSCVLFFCSNIPLVVLLQYIIDVLLQQFYSRIWRIPLF